MNNRRRMIERARKRQRGSLTCTLALSGIAAEIAQNLAGTLKTVVDHLIQVVQAINWDELRRTFEALKLEVADADAERCNE